tara:strand:+ start:126 stop:4079 length:3954 start_codon:yes stop_codon:yes gene_type:complete
MNIDDPKLPIQIYEWKSSSEIEKFTIENIYRDDQIEIAVQKILNFFKYKNIYIWTDDEIVEFTTSIPLNNINPFLYDYTQNIKKIEIFEKKGIFLYSKINIVNIDTVTDNKKILDIFFKYKRPSITINETKLNELYNQTDLSEIKLTTIGYYEFIFNFNMNKTLKYYYKNNNYDYDILFWVYDNYNKHITVKNNKNYTNIIDILNTDSYDNEQLIIIKYLSNNKSYYKITINNTNNVNVKFYLGNKIKYSIKAVLELRDTILKYFKTHSDFNETSIKAQINLNAHHFSKEIFTKKSSLIYNFISKQDKFYIYNRTSNNTQSYNIESYIKELLNNLKGNDGKVTAKYIADILATQTTDISKDDLVEVVENVINNEQNSLIKTKKIYFTQKTFFTINKNDEYNITISVNNIRSILELGYFTYWLSRITYNSKTTKENKEPVKKQSSSSTTVKTESSVDSLDSLNISSGSSDILGGMPGKDVQINQLNILKGLDQDLFNNNLNNRNKTYAQSCGSNRQPMGLPNIKFAKYKTNADQYVDNYLTIGENTYFCPRYWCPTSEHPIKDLKNKCEKGEDPINIYSTNEGTYNKPGNPPRFVHYFDEDNYRKPCCYLKNKKVTIKTPEKTDNEPNKIRDSFSASNTHIYTGYNKIIPYKRYGILPLSILQYLNDNSSGLNCADKLRSKLCAFRAGMKNDKNDLIDILTVLLKYKDRKDLVTTMYNNLDIIKFISLENGNILRDFMKRSVYKDSHRRHDKKIITKNNFNINKKTLKHIQYAITEYFKYLLNDKVNNPHYLYSIIALTLKHNLYIWKYKNDNNFSFLTPLYVKYDNIKMLSGTDKTINIFYNSNINKYEPIILKSTNTSKYVFDISLNNIEISSTVNTDILDKLKEYVALYNHDKDHQIKTVLLNNNLSVNHFILNNNIIIQCDLIEPILLNRLFEIIQCNNIELYDEVMYKNNFEKTINFDNLKYNFNVIHNDLEPQLFKNTVLPYNNIELISEKDNDQELKNLVDNIYYNNITNSKFQDEIQNHNNITDWYNSYNFNNTFMTDNITYNKDTYQFSNKAIGIYKTFFNPKYKTEIIKNEKKHITNTIILDLPFTKGESIKLTSKWDSYNFYYVNSNNYTNNDIYHLLTKIMSKDKTQEIQELAINNIKKLFGSVEGFSLLCYVFDYKNIISNVLKISPNTQVTAIHKKFLKRQDKENDINNIISNNKLKTSEIHLFSASEILDIVIIVIHHRVYNFLNKNKQAVIRNSIEDLGATCNLFINNTIKNQYEQHPLLIIYSDENRLYFVDKQFYNKAHEAPENIKNLVKHKLKTLKKLV